MSTSSRTQEGAAQGKATRDAERQWLSRLKAGEERAFEELVLTYQDQVYHVVLSWVGNEEEAKDVTQEAFVRAWGSIGGFRGDSSLRSWIFAIARNVCRNTFRTWARRHRSSTQPLDPEWSHDGSAPPLEIADNAISVIDQMQETERAQMVRKALQEMDPEFRVVITLCDMEGLSYEEAAQACECPVGTIRSRLARGRLAMKRRLEIFMRGQ